MDRAAVEDTLRKIASTAQGSVIAFDYFTAEVLESQALYLWIMRSSLRAGGEPLKFGLDSRPPSSERLAELLQSCGLSLGEQHTLGQETEGKHALGGFAIALVKQVVMAEPASGRTQVALRARPLARPNVVVQPTSFIVLTSDGTARSGMRRSK